METDMYEATGGIGTGDCDAKPLMVIVIHFRMCRVLSVVFAGREFCLVDKH